MKGLAHEPTAMTLRPVLAARIAMAMAEQKSQQLLARTHQVHRCVHSRSKEIAKRFMRGVWDAHRRQVAGPVGGIGPKGRRQGGVLPAKNRLVAVREVSC